MAQQLQSLADLLSRPGLSLCFCPDGINSIGKHDGCCTLFSNAERSPRSLGPPSQESAWGLGRSCSGQVDRENGPGGLTPPRGHIQDEREGDPHKP